MPNFLLIGQSVAEMWPFLNFSRCWPSAVLYFKKLEILAAITVHRANMRNSAKFRANRTIHCQDMTIFRFLKMAAVRHIGFVVGILGPPTQSTWWSLSCAKWWGYEIWPLPLTLVLASNTAYCATAHIGLRLYEEINLSILLFHLLIN